MRERERENLYIHTRLGSGSSRLKARRIIKLVTAPLILARNQTGLVKYSPRDYRWFAPYEHIAVRLRAYMYMRARVRTSACLSCAEREFLALNLATESRPSRFSTSLHAANHCFLLESCLLGQVLIVRPITRHFTTDRSSARPGAGWDDRALDTVRSRRGDALSGFLLLLPDTVLG